MRFSWSAFARPVQNHAFRFQAPVAFLAAYAAWRAAGGKAGYGNSAYQAEHDVLFDAIRNDKPHNEAEYGALSTMTAIMGRMATYSGKLITWDEAFNSTLALVPKDLSDNMTPPVLPDENGFYPVAKPGITVAL